MSIGLSIAIGAVPFFDLLDEEEASLAEQIAEEGEGPAAASLMDSTRRRLAQSVESVVRSMPTAIRSDLQISRAVAYALVGLADERMLHHPTGGLNRWRERLLEYELYGSALAGQEIVTNARAAAAGTMTAGAAAGSDPSLLAPLYLAIFKEGFEGSMRGDTLGLSNLVASLEETVGTGRGQVSDMAAYTRPPRIGASPLALALIGVLAWLVTGLGVWMFLPQDSLQDARRSAERVISGLPVLPGGGGPLDRSIGPSNLSPVDETREQSQ